MEPMISSKAIFIRLNSSLKEALRFTSNDVSLLYSRGAVGVSTPSYRSHLLAAKLAH